MGIHLSTNLDRRKFLGKCLATGTGLCLGGCALSEAFARKLEQETSPPPAKHKFQEDAGLTYERVMQFAYSSAYIPIMKILAEDLGLDTLEAAATEVATRRTSNWAEKMPSRQLSDLASFFKKPNPFMEHALTKEVVEDSDHVFEIKVTECLWAKIFRESDAAELGQCCICRADFATATAFNPNIELVRDKTLMQGHDCCNHRYLMRS